MRSALPQARVVKKAGVAVAPPPVSLRDRWEAFEDNLGPTARGFLTALFGLWPVTAVILLWLGLVYVTAMQASP